MRIASPHTTLRSEGALLPPDFLQRLTALQSDIPGLTPDAYHLTGEKLNEAASRAWNRLLGVWTAFHSASTDLPIIDPGTTVTREKWLLPLFAELGYGRLQPAKAIEIDGKNYPVSHAWQHVPIHLVGRNVDLDRRTAGVVGAARTSPHGLVQELLNRRPESMWGFVANGLKLRLLRDNRSLTRQAYVEFDLAAMMEGQAFSDFVLLWLLCHQSRVEGEPAETCWLEKWAAAAREQGTRALDELRDGVQQAIEALGRGFLKHPGNGPVVERLRAGALDKQDFYRQLLRLVYRLIFLFVAEARDLLLVAAPGSAPADRYLRYYSVARLRTLAGLRRGTPHADLWQALLVVIRGLSSEHGCPELGLPALGSLLWSDAASPDLDACQLANTDLLDAIRALAFRLDRGVRRPVDWRNLGPEELGSVYESLLELHPEINTASAAFALRVAAGHERKTTGSYYTPTSLVECLLDSALDPVLDEAARASDPERAILALKVCDPACGSGHFLIAAAHRIAKRLASIRTGDAEAAPEAVRAAVRDVIGHCLYGVDMNPMAVELCKVNCWLEALDPGRPLSFLDHHIQCGNALLGTTPALLRMGIPDAAFDPIEGDDREYCRELKKRNKREREGFRSLFTGEPWERLGDLATGLANLGDIDDSTIDGVRQKEARYAEIVRSTGYAHGRLWADAWCAAFVWRKMREAHPITEDLFRTIERNPMAAPEAIRTEIRRIAEEYGFFHWHLVFPDVFHAPKADEPLPDGPGWTGGFDVVLGNPPWERIKIQEKEWFAERRPDIATAPNAAARRRLIARIEGDDPALWRTWREALRHSDAESALIRSSGRYPLCGRGDVNTYAIFAELNRSLLAGRGRAGFIVPTGIATDDTTKSFFQDLVEQHSLVSLFDFENRLATFPGVHRSYKFSLLTLAGRSRASTSSEFAFFCLGVDDLRDPERRFILQASDFALLNPNTRTCPIFRSRRDAELTKAIYRRVAVLINEAKGESGNPWNVSFMTMFHMAGDSPLFRTAPQLEADGWTLRGNVFERGSERCVPLYEAKMVHHFNHRFGDYADKAVDDEGTALPDVPETRLADPTYVVQPRYWVPKTAVDERLEGRWAQEWLLGWRDICRSTDERTVIASVIPRVGVGHTVPLFLSGQAPGNIAALLANASSFVFDYTARQKIGGTHLTYLYLKQLPVLPQTTYDTPAPWFTASRLLDWIGARVLELSLTACDISSFAHDLGWEGPPFRWDPERRFLLRAELDAAFFHLYLLADPTGHWRSAEGETPEELARLTAAFATPRDAVDYMLDTFPIVRRNDEAAHGAYRTKRVILEIYDRMQRAIATGEPYETVLDPPPADPGVAHEAPERAEIR